MLEIIQDQPDDSSYEEILRELAFARMIERGLRLTRPASRRKHPARRVKLPASSLSW